MPLTDITHAEGHYLVLANVFENTASLLL